MKSTAIAREASVPKDANGNAISAQTFTFRELATATRNFRQDCFLGEGGFGRVYKGRLESTCQVTCYSQIHACSCLLLRRMEMAVTFTSNVQNIWTENC